LNDDEIETLREEIINNYKLEHENNNDD